MSHDSHSDDHHPPHDRRFAGEIERLRAPKRLQLLEVSRVVDLCLEGIGTPAMLDVGIGSAIFAEAFYQRGCIPIGGIDLRDDMLEAARAYVPDAELHIANMSALPFDDNAFGLTFMGHVLHEADDVAEALREAHRVTSQRIAVLEWRYAEEDFGPPLHHRLAPDVIISASKDAGLGAVQIHHLAHMVLYRISVDA